MAAVRAPARTRHDLVKGVERVREMRREWLRRAIIDYERDDLLATEVLKYQIKPHHLRCLQHQARYPDEHMILGWRGCGKTTICTVVKGVGRLLRQPDSRTIVATKTATNAVAMLGEMKRNLASDAVESLFGRQAGDKWDDTEFNVRPRRSRAKEANMMAFGYESTVTSRHAEYIEADDLVDLETSRTETMRKKLFDWYYSTLTPCKEPDSGSWSVKGTRYHPKDLYGHLLDNEMAGDKTHVEPALFGDEQQGWQSNWPDKFSVEKLLSLRRTMGPLKFDAQYQCVVTKMLGGGIINYDYIDEINEGAIPTGLPRFLGADLAISPDPRADRFEIVVISWDSIADKIYVLDHFTGQVPFHKQRETCLKWGERHKIARGGIESNGYQLALFQELRRTRPDLPFVKIRADIDKTSKAWQIASLMEDGRLVFKTGLVDLIEGLVGFDGMPGCHDDGLDALWAAIRTIKAKVRRPREEFGLI